MLSDTERKLVLQLGDISSTFCVLCASQPGHQSDVPDFTESIHRLQRIILARPTRRELTEAPE